MSVTSIPSMGTMVWLCSFCASSGVGVLNQIAIFVPLPKASNYSLDSRDNDTTSCRYPYQHCANLSKTREDVSRQMPLP